MDQSESTGDHRDQDDEIATNELVGILGLLVVRAWRIELLPLDPERLTLAKVRGVWGSFLKHLDPIAYDRIFEGRDSDQPAGNRPGGIGEVPRYLFRPAPSRDDRTVALDFLLFGSPHAKDDGSVWEAWDEMDRDVRDRGFFAVVRIVPLAWDGSALEAHRIQPGFPLAPLPWPTREGPTTLRFRTPVHLKEPVHSRPSHGSKSAASKRMLDQPALTDLVIAAIRRLCGLIGTETEPLWERRRWWLERARSIPTEPWFGRYVTCERHSERQRAIVELRGTLGALTLREHPGPLAPLLAAIPWIHLGHASVFGFGHLEIQPGSHATTPQWFATDLKPEAQFFYRPLPNDSSGRYDSQFG